MIEVITKLPQLPFEISGTPKGSVIQQLSTYGSDPLRVTKIEFLRTIGR